MKQKIDVLSKGETMKKKRFFLTLLLTQLLLTGCSQEKVMDTEFIRLKNNVKDIETALKQREEDSIRTNQKIITLEETVNRQKEQISQLISASHEVQSEQKHPVIIQDVKLTSEKMDANGRVWGPYNLNVTIYNGTNHSIKDNLSALILTDDPVKSTNTPKMEQIVQNFELGPKQSKIVSFVDLPINHPSKRLNIIVKLLETTRSPDNEGVLGKATWIVVPTIILPPNNS